MKGPLLILFVIVPIMFGVGQTAAQEADVTKIEQECLAYRRAIKSGHVVLDVVRNHRDAGGGDVESKSQIEIFFEPGKLRFDRRTVVAEPAQTPYHSRCIITPSEVISRSVEIPEGDSNVGTKITDPPGKHSELMVFDPRRLGLATGDVNTICHYDFDTCIGQPKRIETRITTERVGDHEMKVVQHKRMDDLQVRIFFREGDLRYVKAIETRGLFRDKELIDRIDCKYAEPREGVVVFPSRIDFVRMWDGAPAYESTATVKSATFNKEIDPGHFTLATMAMRPGTQIHRLRGTTKEWDGSKEVPLGTIRPLP